MRIAAVSIGRWLPRPLGGGGRTGACAGGGGRAGGHAGERAGARVGGGRVGGATPEPAREEDAASELGPRRCPSSASRSALARPGALEYDLG